jgi:hypothetical protein
VNNRITPLEVRSTTPEEEDMEVVENTKVEEGVEQHLSEDEDRSQL